MKGSKHPQRVKANEWKLPTVLMSKVCFIIILMGDIIKILPFLDAQNCIDSEKSERVTLKSNLHKIQIPALLLQH